MQEEANNIANNKRIAKNTTYLYFRMLFTTIMSLYIARLVLKILGVQDFGIYNVVGGVVTFLGFLTSTMSSATQRYLTFHLGIGDSLKYKQTFSLLINVFLIFCVIAFFILEFVGPFYINHFMNIPEERVQAAQWVFQFSLLSFLFNAFSIPYRSSVVAYEKMNVYAFIGIIEVILHLAVAIALLYINIDHLILYGALMCLSSVIVVISVMVYCRHKLDNCRYIKYWDSKYVKELVSYSGWNLFGATTGVMNLQGQAIVLNYFFGPIVNAAKAVADKVFGLVNQFSANFYMAVTPQIIKSYASGDVNYMRLLVLNSSRYSFFLMFIISVPLIVLMEPLLCLWLGGEQVSLDMVKFCQYTIVYSLVNVLEQPLTMAVRATGNIKKYQIVVGVITLSFIPLCILLFVLGAPSYSSMLLLSLIFFMALIARVHIVSNIIKIKRTAYVREVLLPILFVVMITISIIYLFSFVCSGNEFDVYYIAGFSSMMTILSILIVGLNKDERYMLKRVLNKVLKR